MLQLQLVVQQRPQSNNWSSASFTAGRLTWQTDVVDFEVVVELDVARSPVAERRFDDVQRAPAPPGAAAVQHVEHIDEAPDVAEVRSHAAADLHSTVDGTLDDQHLAGPLTQRLEPSVVAVLARRRRRLQRQRRRQGHCTSSLFIISVLLE